MHIVLAPYSFKESLSASRVAEVLADGFSQVFSDASFDLVPIGDGGEGTLSALVDNLDLSYSEISLSSAFSENGRVSYARRDRFACFEMADICGLEKVSPNDRNPLRLSTRGVGEMISYLLDQGVTELVIGVGGSATNDGGLGMASGLGYRFLDYQGHEVQAIGQNLGRITSVDSSQVKSLSGVTIRILTDVTNPLCGDKGATRSFGAQKGLDSDDFEAVDQSMKQFYRLVNPDIFHLAGAGAGGGMAAGLVTFARGQIVSGIDYVLDVIDFDKRVQKADLVIVGEGRMDAQSLVGKAPIGVARRTPSSIPIVAICGSLKDDLPDFPFENIRAVFPIISRVASLEETLAEAEVNLRRTAKQVANLLILGGFS